MGMLDGDIASFFAATMSGFYLDAQLYRPTAAADDGKGGGAGSDFADPQPVKAQLDQATQAMRSSEGFVDSDQRILVLASGIAAITTDCEITVSGKRWMIASVSRDPAGAYYELRGRRKADA